LALIASLLNPGTIYALWLLRLQVAHGSSASYAMPGNATAQRHFKYALQTDLVSTVIN
jgi:hypothetical protein